MTYRFVGHSRSDPGRYRKPGELDEWRRRDPLVLGRRALAERYGIEAARCDEIDAEVAMQLEEIVERGLAAPFPDPRSVGKEFKDA
jgi:TPP-dependent pyruvate/acetoin dehydrogenase alpha subunit